MNRICGTYFFLILVSFVSFAIDFDQSMTSHVYQDLLLRDNNKALLDYFRTLYVKNGPEKIVDRGVSKNKIPKIIHQIWLGKKMPKEYECYRSSWIAHHPDWVFIFWADSPLNFDRGTTIVSSFQELDIWLNSQVSNDRFCVVDVRKLVFDNRRFYDLAKNYGEKSDILKWEIVYRVGGLYVDTDFECLRPFDELHVMYDLYTGIQPLDTNQVQLGAALYAAVPGHPVLARCVGNIQYNQHIPYIVVKTGPIHFTRCFIEAACLYGTSDVALPAGYLYPCGYEQRGMPRPAWQRPESYAVHHWAGSWLKPEGFEA
jgi:mannosyltransferase OCH1-like enzyme